MRDKGEKHSRAPSRPRKRSFFAGCRFLAPWIRREQARATERGASATLDRDKLFLGDGEIAHRTTTHQTEMRPTLGYTILHLVAAYHTKTTTTNDKKEKKKENKPL